MNYKPFGSGAWFDEKQNALEAFLQSESFEALVTTYVVNGSYIILKLIHPKTLTE